MGFFDTGGVPAAAFGDAFFGGLEKRRERDLEREKMAQEKAYRDQQQGMWDARTQLIMQQIEESKRRGQMEQQKMLMGQDRDSAYRRAVTGMFERPVSGDEFLGGGEGMPHQPTSADMFQTTAPWMTPANMTSLIGKQMEMEKPREVKPREVKEPQLTIVPGAGGKPVWGEKKIGTQVYEKPGKEKVPSIPYAIEKYDKSKKAKQKFKWNEVTGEHDIPIGDPEPVSKQEALAVERTYNIWAAARRKRGESVPDFDWFYEKVYKSPNAMAYIFGGGMPPGIDMPGGKQELKYNPTTGKFE